MRIAGSLLIGGLALWALPGSWDYVHFMAREGTPVLGMPFIVGVPAFRAAAGGAGRAQRLGDLAAPARRGLDDAELRPL